MIAKLSGLIDSLDDDRVIMDVGGVGYLVFCSSRTLGRLTVGEVTRLVIETHVREDHIHLYGFLESSERDWFRLLTTVQGVGAKVGLGILSTLGPEELVQAVAAADKGAIGRANGVGPKLAARIVSELKDKVGHLAFGQAARAGQDGRPAVAPVADGGAVRAEISDAVSALVNLGYTPSDALGAVSRGAATLGEDTTVETLIRAGLSELNPADLGPRQ